MRRLRLTVSLLACIAGALVLAGALMAETGPDEVPVIVVQDSINPATADWVEAALEDAADDGAKLAIIAIDTPGGLDESLREIVQDIFAAPMPVAVYVSPQGARAASAGAYILQAGDIAAMAPATNTGSATPIAISADGSSSDLDAKIKNDAAASLRGMAETHGRNGDLAEEMVVEAINVTAEEALAADFINFISADAQTLIEDMNGFVIVGPKQQTLDTTGLVAVEREMDWQYEALSLLVNPNIAYLLLLVGLVGIAIEIFAPGTVVPGALGSISLILGLYGTAQLPVTVAGAVLILLGVAMLIAEVHLPTAGVLGIAGVISLVAGGLLLFDTDTNAVAISPPVVIVTGALLGGFIIVAGKKALEARKNPVVTGWEEMLGKTGEVRNALDPTGQIFVEGALWRAVMADGSTHAAIGDRVIVESIDGLTLNVRPVDAAPEEPEPEESV